MNESPTDFKRKAVEPFGCMKEGLKLLNVLLGLAGALFCYVGLFLILPVSFASVFIAYTQVFGPGRVQSASPLTPPAPSYR